MTYAEVEKLQVLQTIDATGKGDMKTFASAEPIPKLADILKDFPQLRINIELKAYKPMISRRHWGSEVAKVIRDGNAADRVIVTGFDFFMLRELEKEFPGLRSGFAYDDDFHDSLGAAAEQWFTADDAEQTGKAFEARDSPGFVRWLMEEDVVGRLVASTIVDLEWTVLDATTVDGFHKRGHSVGAYVFYPQDVSHVKNVLSLAEEETVVRRLVAQGVDGMETDAPERLMALLKVIDAERKENAK